MARSGEIALGLIEPVARRERLLLGFEQCDCHRLRFGIEANAQRVVDASAGAATRFTGDDLDWAERDFAGNELLRPTTLIYGRVDEFARVSASLSADIGLRGLRPR